MSERYTHGHHPSVVASHARRTIANSAAYLDGALRAGQRILDLGCGPGTITVELAERVAPGEVVGVDRAPAIVERAAALAAERGVPNVRFITGDAYALDLPDDSFDVAHAHQVLQHLADPVAALRELARVTRPGGLIAVREVDYGGVIWHPALPELDDWMRLYREVHEANGGEPDAGRRLIEWALEAGLDIERVSGSVWVYASPEDRAYWGGSWAERATLSDFAAQAVETGAATTAELERIAAGWRAWADALDGYFLMPHGELLARVPATP